MGLHVGPGRKLRQTRGDARAQGRAALTRHHAHQEARRHWSNSLSRDLVLRGTTHEQLELPLGSCCDRATRQRCDGPAECAITDGV